MKNISRLELENIYGKISPFEFKRIGNFIK